MRIGWFCSYTPLEILLAADLRPVRLRARGRLPTIQDPRIYHLMCPYVRAVFHEAIEDRSSIPEGVVFVNCCDAMRRLHDLWKAFIPTSYVHLLDVPKVRAQEAVEYFAATLRSWARGMEDTFMMKITNEALWDVISMMNRLRRGIHRLTRKMASTPSQITFRKLWGLMSRLLDTELEEAMSLVEKMARIDSDKEISHGGEGSRVLLMSSMLDQMDILDMLEESGLRIVADDLCMGTRHFHLEAEEGLDPYLALAKRYLNRWPCPRMKDSAHRLHYLDRLMEDAEVEGVVFMHLKFCDQAGFEIPILKEHLKKKGVPLLLLENDYTGGGFGQLRVRLEAFAEMLEGVGRLI